MRKQLAAQSPRFFRLGSEQQVYGPGDVVVIPGGTEHEGCFPEDTEVIDLLPRRRQTRLHERRLTTPHSAPPAVIRRRRLRRRKGG
jgi:hypothetical protein